VTLTLILLNTVFFALASLTGIAEEFGLRPASIMRGEGLHTLLTSFFMHASVTHLLGNMLILLIIGFVIERKMGAPKFLLFYLMVGLVVSVADLAMRPGSSIPSVGASGAIAGLFGACLIGATDARAPLFFLFFMLSPTLIFLMLLGFVFLLLAVFFSMLLFIMVILALFDPRYRKTWYLIPFLSVWVLSQALLGAVGMFAMGVHYWAHAVGIGVGLSGWLLMKREKIRVFSVEGVPPIR
jgi:membrane associated rhomboid family serine protease